MDAVWTCCTCAHTADVRPYKLTQLRSTPAWKRWNLASLKHWLDDHLSTNLLPAQAMMQYATAQKRRIFALRQDYITQLALSLKHCQQLHQDLLSSPGASGLSKDELIDSHVTVRAITQQLEDCAAHEHKLFMQYTIAVARGVRLYDAQYTVFSFPASLSVTIRVEVCDIIDTTVESKRHILLHLCVLTP